MRFLVSLLDKIGMGLLNSDAKCVDVRIDEYYALYSVPIIPNDLGDRFMLTIKDFDLLSFRIKSS